MLVLFKTMRLHCIRVAIDAIRSTLHAPFRLSSQLRRGEGVRSTVVTVETRMEEVLPTLSAPLMSPEVRTAVNIVSLSHTSLVVHRLRN